MSIEFTGPNHYRYQNWELFGMAVDELNLTYDDIDRVDRKERVIHSRTHGLIKMPDHWDVGTNSRPSVE